MLSNNVCEQGSPHLIRRDHLYSDVIQLYENFERLRNEFPFRIAFDDENAWDSGGVSRDLFSGFWKCAFDKFFDGSGNLVPATHPNVDMGLFPFLGRILSHGYLVSGFLPVHVAFPVLAAVLLGPTICIKDSVLTESFIDHLSCYDASILKDAFLECGRGCSNFSPIVRSKLLALLGNFGCRQIPSPAMLMSIISSIAKHEFFIKPSAAIYSMHGGIPSTQDFWKGTELDHLLQIYKASNSSASNVLQVLEEPPFSDELQSSIYGYLLQYIGNMQPHDVRKFLRFVTGSSALIVDKISITFNGLSGVARRPIAHTCSCVLELPVSYSTYIEFSCEFDQILSSEMSWIMDAL